MNYIFFFLIAISIIAGFANGTMSDVTKAMMDSCDVAVKISLSLIGIMAFWLGIMRVAEKSGLIQLLSKLIYPIVKPLFKDLDKDDPVVGDITMSLSANALGLTNAATPIGLKVMKELQDKNKNSDIATDSMCMFLGMNTAGFQIIPATVIAVLAGLGCKNPSIIIIPALIVTCLSFLTAIVISLIFARLWQKEDR